MTDRYCEFCVNMRSVVYCNADAAYLCLSCDNKVHSANPLSNRHHRTLICETCRRRPSTYVQNYDRHNKTFVCHDCDLSQHNHVTSQHHKKRVMNSYVGCPSARDLGVLWGFDLNRFVHDGSGNILLNPDLGSNSSSSVKKSVGLQTHNVHIIKEEMDGSFILEQLVDLLMVETCDVDRNVSTIIRCQQAENDVNYQVSTQQRLLDDHDTIPNPCLSLITQLDHLEESETDETRLQQDSFWQCNSRINPSNQLWSQNMQDLGVCEETSCLDDLNIPDIDLTFKNFEELFKIEQDPTNIHQDTFISTFVTNTKSSPKKARYTSQIRLISHSSLGPESSGISQYSYESIRPYESHVTFGGKKKVQVIRIDSKQGHCCYRKARSIRHKKKNKIPKLIGSHA